MRFVDQYDVILLDLNGTFMFEQDRFGPDQDYYQTYVSLGGRGLPPGAVRDLVAECHREMSRLYDDPARCENFAGYAEVLSEICRAPLEEIPLLEGVLTVHELGNVPTPHAECLRMLARSHDLGIVSNIWGKPDAWLRYLEGVGLTSLFKCMVFSSEGRTMKPSLTLFRRALDTFAPSSRVLFVGDSHERDVVPAKTMGWAAAWIAPAGRQSPIADATVTSLLELPDLKIMTDIDPLMRASPAGCR